MKKCLYFTILLILFSCGHKIRQGVIVEKYYEPARYYHWVQMMPVGKTYVPIVHTSYDDEDFVIKVKGAYNGKDRTETFYLSERDWVCLNQGGHFNDSIPCERIDDGNK